MSLNVVPIRDAAPSLADIPGMLRKMAADIEKGEHGKVDSLFVLIPTDEGCPALFGWGDVDDHNLIVELEMAKAWLLKNMMD